MSRRPVVRRQSEVRPTLAKRRPQSPVRDVVFRLLVTGVITPTQVEQAVTRTNGSGTPEPPAPRPVEPAPETPVDPGLATVTTAEKVYGLAAGSCRWPTGDPRHPDFHFCGSPAAAGVYCARHHVMAHMHDTMERQESRRPEQPVRMVGIGNQGELHRTFSAAASL